MFLQLQLTIAFAIERLPMWRHTFHFTSYIYCITESTFTLKISATACWFQFYLLYSNKYIFAFSHQLCRSFRDKRTDQDISVRSLCKYLLNTCNCIFCYQKSLLWFKISYTFNPRADNFSGYCAKIFLRFRCFAVTSRTFLSTLKSFAFSQRLCLPELRSRGFLKQQNHRSLCQTKRI